MSVDSTLEQYIAQYVALTTALWSLETQHFQMVSAYSTPNPRVFLFGMQHDEDQLTHVVIRVDTEKYTSEYEHLVPDDWFEGAVKIPLLDMAGKPEWL